MPHREPELELEIDQGIGAVHVDLPCELLSAQPQQCSRRQPNFLPEMREQHDPAQRRRMSGDEPTMVAPRADARDRARSEAAKPVGDEPLIVDERFRCGLGTPSPASARMRWVGVSVIHENESGPAVPTGFM